MREFLKAAAAALAAGRSGDELREYEQAYENSWVYEDLKGVKNVKPMWSRAHSSICLACIKKD